MNAIKQLFMKSILVVVLVLIAAAALAAACAPVATLNALTPSDTHVLTQSVAYGPDARQRADIYQPRTAAPANGFPTVVFFYGGARNRGDRADYRFVGEALASRGILTILADYRLYPQVRYPEFLRDSAAALAWAREQAPRLGGDTKRLFVMGHSAGAYNAAMLALDARWLGAVNLSPAILAGWIGLAGPYDFLPMTNPDAQPVFFHPAYPKDSQPIAYASATAPATFLAAAQTDELVNPQRNTRQMAQKLAAAGVAVTLRSYDKPDHGTLIGAFARPLRWLAPVLDDVGAFVRDQAPTR